MTPLLPSETQGAFHSPPTRLILIAVVIVIVLTKWLVFMSGDRFGGDNDANIEMGYNIATFGVISDSEISLERGEIPRPSNYREPLPSVLLAGFIKTWTVFNGPHDVSFFKKGRGARFLRLSNIVWGVVLCWAVGAALWTMTASFPLSIVGAGLVGLAAETNAHLTENAATAFIALASLFFMRALTGNRARDYALAGLALGALTLTKGAFQYIALVLFLGLVGWLLTSAVLQRLSLSHAIGNGALFAVGILIVVTPWVARNSIYLGTPQITQRAGIVLYTRAIKNEMTPEEHLGAFYVWAPRILRGTMGAVLGFGPKDLQKGGRLQRLNRNKSADFLAEDTAAENTGRPEDAISFFRKARAERTKVRRMFNADGVEQAGRRTDSELQSRAMAMILGDPWRHLVMTPLFLWRGAAFESPLLALAAGLALGWGRRDLFAYVMPALLMIAFYALLSHNIPRYNDPVFAVVFAALIATGHYGLKPHIQNRQN